MLVKKILAYVVAAATLPVCTGIHTVRAEELFYGVYDMTQTSPESEDGVLLSQVVPDGDYTVTVTTGGETKTNANIYINGGERVRAYTLAEGEMQENIQAVVPLDGKISVQIKGENPNVTRIEIEQLPNRREKGEKPTIYIAGDSTAQTYDHTNVYPQTGWGQVFADYFSDDVIIENRSMGGRSLKSYNNDGRLDSILTEMHPGDYVFIQFGINDGAVNKPERYISVEDYKALLTEKYIGEIRKRGGIPVLLTATAAAWYDEEKGEFMESRQDYAVPTKEVAEETGVILLDVNAALTSTWNDLGKSLTENLYFVCEQLESKVYPAGTNDRTHLKESGARAVASIVASLVYFTIGELSEFTETHDLMNAVQNENEHWAYDAMILARMYGVIHGNETGDYEPERNITRAEYLKMIMEACNLSGHAYREGECLDASDDAWYGCYLQGALDNDLIPEAMIRNCNKKPCVKVLAEPTNEKEAVTAEINVYSGEFNGEDFITREEMAALTMSCISYLQKNSDDVPVFAQREDEATLADVENISPEYRNAVEAAFNNCIVEGDDDFMFAPDATLTKAEAATVLMRIIGSWTTYVNLIK